MLALRCILRAALFGREVKRILNSLRRWSVGKAPLFPEKFPGAKAGIWYRCPNEFWSRHSLCIRESTSSALCHSQGCERIIGQAVESLLRFQDAGCSGHSTLINLALKLGQPCDPVAHLLGTFPYRTNGLRHSKQLYFVYKHQLLLDYAKKIFKEKLCLRILRMCFYDL